MLTVMLLAAGTCVQGQVAPRVIEPPTDQQVLRAVGGPRNRPQANVFWDDIVIVKTRVALKQPRLFGVKLPVADAHWQCVAYYKETVAWPFGLKWSQSREKTVFIDKADVVR